MICAVEKEPHGPSFKPLTQAIEHGRAFLLKYVWPGGVLCETPSYFQKTQHDMFLFVTKTSNTRDPWPSTDTRDFMSPATFTTRPRPPCTVAVYCQWRHLMGSPIRGDLLRCWCHDDSSKYADKHPLRVMRMSHDQRKADDNGGITSSGCHQDPDTRGSVAGRW